MRKFCSKHLQTVGIKWCKEKDYLHLLNILGDIESSHVPVLFFFPPVFLNFTFIGDVAKCDWFETYHREQTGPRDKSNS